MFYLKELFNGREKVATGNLKKVTINSLQELCEIKAHTLRTWEKRYGFPKPERSSNNFRYYSVDELERVLKISLLNKSGFKISYLARLAEPSVDSLINKLTSDKDKKERAINELIICMYRMKTEEFEMVLNICCLTWAIDTLIKEIILAFLRRTNLLWHGNRLTEEHFIVTAIRKKLMLGLEKAEILRQREKKALLFLPDNKQLDLILLYTNYILKTRGWQVYYMGNDVSLFNLKSVIELKKPSMVFTYLPKTHNFPISELSDFMCESLPEAVITVATYSEYDQADQCRTNIQWLSFEKSLSFMLEG